VKPELEQKLAKETKPSLPSLPSVQPLSSFLCGLCSQWSRGHVITLRNHHPRCRLRNLECAGLTAPCRNGGSTPISAAALSSQRDAKAASSRRTP
jgi:hypothetical protein